eukprot:scaffold275848_cov19-Tisochrysis_lutea.AAC.1
MHTLAMDSCSRIPDPSQITQGQATWVAGMCTQPICTKRQGGRAHTLGRRGHHVAHNQTVALPGCYFPRP